MMRRWYAHLVATSLTDGGYHEREYEVVEVFADTAADAIVAACTRLRAQLPAACPVLRIMVSERGEPVLPEGCG